MLDGLLAAVNAGTAGAAERLFEVVYEELRRIASAHRRREGSRGGGATLQTSDLVHEAYFKLVRPGATWGDRRHFYGAAANAMRQILVERARKRATAKRNMGAVATPEVPAVTPCEAEVDWVHLDNLLGELERERPRMAKVVMLKFFAGLEHLAIAEMLEVNERTVARDWKAARAWLHAGMRGEVVPNGTGHTRSVSGTSGPSGLGRLTERRGSP